jgi:predicted alpha/beta hydrolase family esterase
MRPPLLLVPGWENSKPAHWQSLWEAATPGARRAEMPDWYVPELAGWVAALEKAIAACPTPPILACHSLGCITLAHWTVQHQRPVHAALLVAPADVDRPTCPEPLRGFAPIPLLRLPFPTHVVTSEDDPYLNPDRAEEFATAWGSAFTRLRTGGHFNATSGYGPWAFGEELLASLWAGSGAAAELD